MTRSLSAKNRVENGVPYDTLAVRKK